MGLNFKPAVDPITHGYRFAGSLMRLAKAQAANIITTPQDEESERLITSDHLSLNIHLPPKWFVLGPQSPFFFFQNFLYRKRTFENVKLLFRKYPKYPLSTCTSFRLPVQLPKMNSWRPKTFNAPYLPRCKTSLPPFGRSNGCIWKVHHLPHVSGSRLTFLRTELQGHSIKNQDLLVASGTVSLRGSDGLNAVDDDVQAAVCSRYHSSPSSFRTLDSCAHTPVASSC